ncbi:MAG: tRNA pseudouridine(38-40) synthase TruA [Candidatus Kapaibacterium sp.]
MKTLIIKFQFDGTDFVGWQMQPGQRSLQGELTKAFELKTGNKYKIIVAGRTDTGVHGISQIATIKIDDFRIPEEKIVSAINTVLPNDVQLIDAQIIDENYNARFDAISREYSYYITNDYSVFKRRYFANYKEKLDINLMNDAAQSIIGEYDFTTYSKVNNDLNHYRCILERCQWIRINETDIKLNIKSNRFVYSMVRSLVGTMVDIGSGKLEVDYLKDSLFAKDRSLCSTIAPANGLFFEKAYFNSIYNILK